MSDMQVKNDTSETHINTGFYRLAQKKQEKRAFFVKKVLCKTHKGANITLSIKSQKRAGELSRTKGGF